MSHISCKLSSPNLSQFNELGEDSLEESWDTAPDSDDSVDVRVYPESIHDAQSHKAHPAMTDA